MASITLFDLLWGSLAIGLAGMLLGPELARWWRGHQLRRRAARARAGELAAPKLLRSEGYQVVAEQLSQESGLRVDGVWQSTKIRADYLAIRRGKQYVVEVKTGRSAPNPTNSATRRQLLEYDRAFDADGLILADMERKRLHRIEFADQGPIRRGFWHWGWAMFVGLLIGLFAGRQFQPPQPDSPPVECEPAATTE